MKLNNAKKTKWHLLDIEREKDQMLTSSMENEPTVKWDALAKSSEEIFLSKPNFQNSPNGKNNLPTLSIYRIFGVFKDAL